MRELLALILIAVAAFGNQSGIQSVNPEQIVSSIQEQLQQFMSSTDFNGFKLSSRSIGGNRSGNIFGSRKLSDRGAIAKLHRVDSPGNFTSHGRPYGRKKGRINAL